MAASLLKSFSQRKRGSTHRASSTLEYAGLIRDYENRLSHYSVDGLVQLSDGTQVEERLTELHEAVMSPHLNGKNLQKVLDSDPSAAKVTWEGLYPIHHLAQNTCKSRFTDDVQDFAVKLALTYTPALELREVDDTLVILKPIFDWVESKRKKSLEAIASLVKKDDLVDVKLSESGSNSSDISETSDRYGSVVSMFRKASANASKSKSIQIEFVDEIKNINDKSVLAQLLLELAEAIPDEYVWIVEVLSRIIELGHRLPKNNTCLDTILHEILSNLASYKGFLRTFIVMDVTPSKQKVYSSTLMKLTMLQPESVPPSLVNILDSKSAFGEKGIQYLKELSKLLSGSVGGLVDIQTRSDVEKRLLVMQQKMFDAVEAMPDILRAANSLDQTCSEIRIIQRMVDRSFFSIFPRSMLMCDVGFNIIMMIAFNVMTWAYMVDYDISTYMIATQFTMLSVYYFLCREAIEVLSFSSSLQVFVENIIDVWNFIDYGAILFTLSASVQMDFYLSSEHSDATPIPPVIRGLTAGAVIFQSLKLIKLFRMFNEQFAVFILAVVQIFIDIKWFMVVLLTVMGTFSLVFIYVLPGTNVREPCTEANKNAEGFEACQPTNHLKSTYELMLGDWDIEEQFNTPTSYLLFVAYTLIVTIVLLNILIAIASQAFELIQEAGPILFRAERMDFSAELRTMQRYLARPSCSLASLATISYAILFYFTYYSWDQTVCCLPEGMTVKTAEKILYGSVILTISIFILTTWFLLHAARVDTNAYESNENSKRSLVGRTFASLWGNIEEGDTEQDEDTDVRNTGSFERNQEKHMQHQIESLREELKSFHVLKEQLAGLQEILLERKKEC